MLNQERPSDWIIREIPQSDLLQRHAILHFTEKGVMELNDERENK